jgi:glycosyltransferase involved in cell wall biosynthesis
MNQRKIIRILLIGHMASHVSGSSLSFKQLVDSLQKNENVLIHVINTARPVHLTSSWLSNVMTAFKVTCAILLKIRYVDVVTFHASRPAMMSYGPIIYLLTQFFGKPLVLRLFGGALELEYENFSSLRRFLFDKTVLKADLLLLQTKHLVSYFRQISVSVVRWYSNSRKLFDNKSDQENSISRCKKFIFLGRVVEEKGIEVILESVPFLNTGISIDIFGSFDGNYTAEKINKKGKGIVNYKGVLKFEQVLCTLMDYDALILPTFYPGEGYPGVILEAYSRGIPVVATRWRAIPEIVDNTSGILIPVQDSDALAQAMNDLFTDNALYKRLRRGAQTKRLEFSDKLWIDRFVVWCYELTSVNGTGPKEY